MGKYAHLFQTIQERDNYIKSSAYTEPFVARCGGPGEQGIASFTKDADDIIHPKHNGHAYVDLGLRRNGKKILFATTNIGANKPEEYGDYFMWGNTNKTYSYIDWENGIDDGYGFYYYPVINYSLSPSYWDNINEEWTKYNDTDNKPTLDASDDVATVVWGGNWRLPNDSDVEYLISSSCTMEWNSNYMNSNISGYIIVGKGIYSNNSIFLPSAGYVCSDSFYYGSGSCAYYMTNFREVGDDGWGCYSLSFLEGDGIRLQYDSRETGYSVRPVLELPE